MKVHTQSWSKFGLVFLFFLFIMWTICIAKTPRIGGHWAKVPVAKNTKILEREIVNKEIIDIYIYENSIFLYDISIERGKVADAIADWMDLSGYSIEDADSKDYFVIRLKVDHEAKWGIVKSVLKDISSIDIYDVTFVCGEHDVVGPILTTPTIRLSW